MDLAMLFIFPPRLHYFYVLINSGLRFLELIHDFAPFKYSPYQKAVVGLSNASTLSSKSRK
jgi:hypothetical protein